MKFVAFLFLILAAGVTPYPELQLTSQLRDINIVRSGSDLQLAGRRWTVAGGNIYWLGLDENVIPPPGQPFYAPTNASYPTKGRTTEIMNTLNTMGARAFRCHTCGVSVGNPLSIWPTLGETNEQAFETIDWAVFQARSHGLRLFAPLTDNYDYYHGGKCVFLRWRGIDITCLSNVTLNSVVQQFYLNETIISDFKDYIRTLLTHKNRYTGLTYAEDPTIFAYETGNELGGPTFGDMDVPVSWTTEIASYIKELAPLKLVIDGTYGVVPSHLDINEVDIYSDHFYPPNNTKLQADLDLVSNANKVYIAGEYDWTGNNPDGSSLDSWFDIIEQYQAATKQVIAGDHFWSLFMHNVPDCTVFVQHNDGETMHYNDPNNTAFNNSQIAKVREHLFKMMGENVDDTLPPVACPGPLWTN